MEVRKDGSEDVTEEISQTSQKAFKIVCSDAVSMLLGTIWIEATMKSVVEDQMVLVILDCDIWRRDTATIWDEREVWRLNSILNIQLWDMSKIIED